MKVCRLCRQRFDDGLLLCPFDAVLLLLDEDEEDRALERSLRRQAFEPPPAPDAATSALRPKAS